MTNRTHIRISVAVLLVLSAFATSSLAQMNKAVGLLKGEVVSTDGLPIKDVAISIFNGGSRTAATKSTESGKFQAILPSNATYRIVFSSPTYGAYEEMLTVPALAKYQEFPMHVTLRALRDGEVMTPTEPIFSAKGYDIRPEAKAKMEDIASFVGKNPKLTIAVAVYPDAAINGKKDAAQQKLLDSRANTLRSFFMSKGLKAQSFTINPSTQPPAGVASAPVAEAPKKGKKKAKTPAKAPVVAPSASGPIHYAEIVAHLNG